jgi:hypothetical protein
MTPLVKTPIVTLDAPAADPVGASNATGNMTAGASNSTLAQPNVGTGGMVIDQAEANTPAGFDPGPGGGGGSVASGGTEMGLADAARQTRGSRGQNNARVYTNEDIQRLNQAPGFRSGEQIEREPALASAAQPESGEAIQGEGVTPMAPEGQGQPIAEQGAGQTADVAPDRVVTDTRRTRGTAGATAQQPQAQEQSGDEREQLPASASPLPLMALLGVLLAGGGVALVLRRR